LGKQGVSLRSGNDFGYGELIYCSQKMAIYRAGPGGYIYTGSMCRGIKSGGGGFFGD
jgi:hypothetical protein